MVEEWAFYGMGKRWKGDFLRKKCREDYPRLAAAAEIPHQVGNQTGTRSGTRTPDYGQVAQKESAQKPVQKSLLY